MSMIAKVESAVFAKDDTLERIVFCFLWSMGFTLPPLSVDCVL